MGDGDQGWFDFNEGSGDEQAENLERVTARIGISIMGFCARHVKRTFFMRDLENHVRLEIGSKAVAPDSASRILRSLRQRGVLDYRVLSRSQSQYEVISVRGTVSREESTLP